MLNSIMIALAALFVSTGAARADAVAYSCHAAPNVKPVQKEGCAGFEATDENGRVTSRVPGGYSISGMILASTDGRSVVMVHTFPYSVGKLETKDAIVFFRDGKEVKRYSMKDIIQRMELTTETTSHHRWLQVPLLDLTLGDKLVISTTSQKTYTFEVATGKMLSSDDTALWKKCDLLAYAAESIKSSGGVHVIEKAWLAKGKLPAGNGTKLSFVAATGVQVPDRSGITLCLVPDKQHGWKAIEKLDLMFNQLPR